MGKKKTVIIFGGQSSEHDISCMSAVNIIRCINKETYNIVLVGITKDGRWLKVNSVDDISSGAWRESCVSAMILPDAQKQAVLYHYEDLLAA